MFLQNIRRKRMHKKTWFEEKLKEKRKMKSNDNDDDDDIIV